MGEAKRREEKRRKELEQAIGVQTAGGRIQVQWDERTAATPQGQMAFFIEFLSMTGILDGWIEECPLQYGSGNGSSPRDIVGTWLLSILSGHKRYAHITTLRADGVNPGLLGMKEVVSEDTVRRGLQAIEETAGVQWLQRHIDKSTEALLRMPWIMDVDVTVKLLYGRQEGAEIGYNPKKPGRPSHSYHSYQMGGLRLVLGVDVEAGNAGHAVQTLPGMTGLIRKLPEEKRPALVRGDAGYGCEPVLAGLEELGSEYLFKLRLTANVRRYIETVFWEEDWQDAGQGWEGREGHLKLSGWSRGRRVILLRRALVGDLLVADESQQQVLAFLQGERPVKRYEYAVLVTSLPHEVLTLAQLYRDRADSENAFDELKNQWGWGGFTTKDLKRCRLSALAVALVYNWWSLFVRLANPTSRMEAITSRPFLLSGVARRTSHAGQQHLSITPVHGKGKQAKEMLVRVSRLLNQWKTAAEQFPLQSVWRSVCDHIAAAVTGLNSLIRPLLPASSSA